MHVDGIVIEQIEDDGGLLSLLMSSTESLPLEVAKPNEMEGQCNDPLRFKAKEHKNQYEEVFTNNPTSVRLTAPTFQRNNQEIFINSHKYFGVPVKTYISYYILSFPEYAIPQSLSIIDPLNQGNEYHRGIVRDDLRKRYTIYVRVIEPRQFNIILTSKLKIDRVGFSTSQYEDSYTHKDIDGQYDWLYPINHSDWQEKKDEVDEKLGRRNQNCRINLMSQNEIAGDEEGVSEGKTRIIVNLNNFNRTDSKQLLQDLIYNPQGVVYNKDRHGDRQPNRLKEVLKNNLTENDFQMIKKYLRKRKNQIILGDIIFEEKK